MSKLFRTKDHLTLAQLARAWSAELVEAGEDPKQREQYLVHLLQEDIVNGRLDDSGPLHNDVRLGLRCIRPDGKAGLVEGRQLLEFFAPGQDWSLDYVIIMKEAVLDFAKRRELTTPSWWSQSATIPSDTPNQTNETAMDPIAVPSARMGKQPRILKYLSEHFPYGVPEPGLCPQDELKAEILKSDRRLGPLDEATLKKGIDNYNASLTGHKIDPK
jgi:hypothetical protein